MSESKGCFCRFYRPFGALVLLAAILWMLVSSGKITLPAALAPRVKATATAVPTQVPPTLVPTAVPPTLVPTAVPPAEVPTVVPTAEPTLAVVVQEPTAAPTAVQPVFLPALNLPTAADITADGLTLRGTGQPGATVELWEGAIKIGTGVVGADGVWSLLSQLGEGAHRLVLRTVDAAGNTLSELPAVEIQVPAIALPTFHPPHAVDLTDDGLRLSGTGHPGATLELWEDGVRIGTAVVAADGTWSVVSKLSVGAHSIVLRTVDAAGQTLNELPAVSITMPAMPAAPAVTKDLAASGEAYTVKAGDWLTKLAERFYGDGELWKRIVDGTNARAAVDATFEAITDPNRIYVGQKLWIPAKRAGQ